RPPSPPTPPPAPTSSLRSSSTACSLTEAAPDVPPMPRFRLFLLPLLLAGVPSAGRTQEAPAAVTPQVAGTDADTPCYATTAGLVGDCDVHPAAQATSAPLALSVDEAVQIALERNYAVQLAELDVANANA